MSSSYVKIVFYLTIPQREKLLDFITKWSRLARSWTGTELPTLQRALVRLRSALAHTEPAKRTDGQYE